jgi:hypothetical protein
MAQAGTEVISKSLNRDVLPLPQMENRSTIKLKHGINMKFSFLEGKSSTAIKGLNWCLYEYISLHE